MKRFFIGLVMCSLFAASGAFAQSHSSPEAAAAAARAEMERQRMIEALELKQLKDAREMADRDKQRGDMLEAKRLQNAMDEAKRQQYDLHNSALMLEKQSDGMVHEPGEWDAKQHEAYQKSLMEITKQQQLLEEDARKQLEEDLKKR